jgi:outer membrane protein OmpA-like peptidoglycan-associated protein
MMFSHARHLESNDMRRNLFTFLILTASATVLMPPVAHAQTASATSTTAQQTSETRPATTSVAGDTGLWFLPTAEVLPHKKWSISLYRANADFGQGFTDVSNFPLTFALGVSGRAEIFGSWTAITRIDRDTRPLFFTSTTDAPEDAGGGVVNEYPWVRQQWSGNARGDFRAGVKFNLLSQADNKQMALAVRGELKAPIGDEDKGASTGKMDVTVDLVASHENGKVELAAFGGFITRGDPDAFELSNGIRYGIGLAVPSRKGLRLTTESHGEWYRTDEVIAPANFRATDGSTAPILSQNARPLYAAVGLTWQAPTGFFIGGGLNWSGSVGRRADARCVGNSCAPMNNGFRDSVGIQARIGYHPGVRVYTAPVAPPPPVVVAAPPVVAPPPANRPPTVTAACDPCTVEVGKVATVTSVCTDPDGDTPLTYRWTATAGSLSNATTASTPWTAPMVVGAVPFTVTCTDPAGLSASANVTIQVVQPVVKEYVFEDVHFDFDRNSLRPDALRVLDEAIEALKANPTLNLLIEGHTCNIGTPEYNMALADRRAQAVRDYLNSRGVDPNRLRTVSYGEERPKHDNDREETRRLNRRAALVVSVVSVVR